MVVKGYRHDLEEGLYALFFTLYGLSCCICEILYSWLADCPSTKAEHFLNSLGVRCCFV